MKRKTEADRETYDVTETECVICGDKLYDTESDCFTVSLLGDDKKEHDICEGCFEEFLPNIGQRMDEVEDVPHALSPEHFAYFERIIAHTNRQPVPKWVEEHGAEYDVPPEIENNPRLTDQSWHNEAWPVFHVSDFCQKMAIQICIAVRSPIKAARNTEHGDKRFVLSAYTDLQEELRPEEDHDDVNEVLRRAFEIADELKREHPEAVNDAQPVKPDFHKGNPRFVWNVGAIAEQFPDMLGINEHYPDRLVLWDRQQNAPALIFGDGYGNAFCLEVTSHVLGSPFTNLETWFNSASVAQALQSEGIPATQPPFTVTERGQQ